MGISFNPNPFNIGLISLQLNNKSRVNFGNTQSNDNFQNNSVDKLFNKDEIKYLIRKNTNVWKILIQNKIPLKLNIKELQDLRDNHCTNTRDLAGRIAHNLSPAQRQRVNLKDLKDAAMLHDFGKVLIPTDILNKPSTLSPQERQIMNLHIILGYEILKNSGVNENVLELVKYHHANIPNKPSDINLEILKLADKYCALTEQRPYKNTYTPVQALTILSQEVQNKNINPYVFNALVKCINEVDLKKHINIS